MPSFDTVAVTVDFLLTSRDTCKLMERELSSSSETLRRAIWDSLLDAELHARYWEYLCRLYYRMDKYTKMFLALTSSSTVASWGFWSEIGFMWKTLSGLSAVTAIILPILNWRGNTQRMSKLSGKYSQIQYQYENLLLDYESGRDLSKIEEQYKRIREKEFSTRHYWK
jgi:hypothetical protein